MTIKFSNNIGGHSATHPIIICSIWKFKTYDNVKLELCWYHTHGIIVNVETDDVLTLKTRILLINCPAFSYLQITGILCGIKFNMLEI